jgi:RNA polymerase sigma factor (sigma-70 family)
MSTESLGETTTVIVRKCAAGDQSALEDLVLRYNWKMVQLANRYMRRLRAYKATGDAQDAVNDTLVKLCQRAIDGELRCIESSNEFWRMFFSMLKVEIRDARDRDDAWKRGGPGARRSRASSAGLAAGPDGVPLLRRIPRLSELSVDSVYSLLPRPEDLALIKLEIEEFLEHLDDPISRQIAQLRVESYTNDEIAKLLDLNERTIERRLTKIRECYLKYFGGS